MQTHNRDFVHGLEKGLSIIEAFEASSPRLTVTEAARKTGLTRAAARRHLLTLAALDYADYDGKYFWLTHRILRLGYAYFTTASLPVLAQPVLDRIGASTKEVTSLGAVDHTEIVFLARSASRRHFALTTSVGMRLPIYCSAIGRVILASWPDGEAEQLLKSIRPQRLTPHTKIGANEIMTEIIKVRTDGYSIVEEELEIGLHSIAVPIAVSGGRANLGMSVSLQAGRMSVAELTQQILPLLQEEKRTLETML